MLMMWYDCVRDGVLKAKALASKHLEDKFSRCFEAMAFMSLALASEIKSLEVKPLILILLALNVSFIY